MTTSIYDVHNKAIACDTRWSAKWTQTAEDSTEVTVIIYTDHSPFHKMAMKEKTAIIFAGDGVLISEWKSWWNNDSGFDLSKAGDIALRSNGKVVLTIIDMANNQHIFDFGQKFALIEESTHEPLCIFMGSGATYAAPVWQNTQCYEQSIINAANFDYFTSPIVKKVDFDSGESNIDTDSDVYSDIITSIEKDGKMLVLNAENQVEKVLDFNASEVANDAIGALKSGKIVASSPVPGITRANWSPEKIENLKSTLRKVAEEEGIAVTE